MISGSCFRVNPEGNLRGKSGEFGMLKLIMLADIESYTVPPGSFVQPGGCPYIKHNLSNC